MAGLYFAPDLDDLFFVVRYDCQVSYLEIYIGLRDSIKKKIKKIVKVRTHSALFAASY